MLLSSSSNVSISVSRSAGTAAQPIKLNALKIPSRTCRVRSQMLMVAGVVFAIVAGPDGLALP